MKANEIADSLLAFYYPKGRHFCTTNFTGCGLAECDVIMVTESNMIYEYEIKCSISDFLADFKKVAKHERLKGTAQIKEKHSDDYFLEWTGTAGRPNYFYYACKENLIPLSEIPPYAGLVYINGDMVEVIKKAPKLHKHKCKPELINQICRNLTARMIYGCSFMNFKNRK